MLVYGFETVLPVEVTIYTHRITTFHEDLNNKAIREALNSLPMVRGDAYLENIS